MFAEIDFIVLMFWVPMIPMMYESRVSMIHKFNWYTSFNFGYNMHFSNTAILVHCRNNCFIL